MEAEERVLRLRKQKRAWFEKMMRAVSRGIDSVEELERVEREEAESLAAARAPELSSLPPPAPSSPGADFVLPWDVVPPASSSLAE